MRRILVTALLICACAGAGHAQLFRRAPPRAPPPAPPPGEAPLPPDPKAWWEDAQPKPPEAADPLGGRRLPHGARLAPVDNGIDPSTYRLWGLMPLQWQVLRPGEMILEVWVRPATSVRQSVARVVVRRDGRTFVQGRAGYACCEAEISRRIAFDAELPAGSEQAFLALGDRPLWSTPRIVRLSEGRGTTEGVCVNGVGYDLTLMLPGRSRSLHRACDAAAIGQVADVLEPTLRAALGQDPRFDVLYPGGISFASDRQAYQDLLAQGGGLRPDPAARPPQPPGAEPAPRMEGAAAAPATPSAPAPALRR